MNQPKLVLLDPTYEAFTSGFGKHNVRAIAPQPKSLTSLRIGLLSNGAPTRSSPKSKPPVGSALKVKDQFGVDDGRGAEFPTRTLKFTQSAGRLVGL